MGTRITLGSTDVTPYVVLGSVSYGPFDIGGSHISLANFELKSTTPVVPENDLYVAITRPDGINLAFSGLVRQPKDRQETRRLDGVRYLVTCQGWGAVLRETIITNTESYPAGVSDRYIVADLLAKYYGPIGTGLAHVLYSRRSSMPAVTWTGGRTSLAQAFDDIAALAHGAVWWPGEDKRFHWNDLFSVAPFALSDAPDGRPSYHDEVIADAPVGYWRLGDKSGTVAKDSSGNGRDGTYVGGVMLGAAGAIGDGDAAAKFDGTTGYVDLGDVAALKPAQVTVEVWYRSTDTDGMLVACPVTPYGYDIWVTETTGLPRWEFDGVSAAVRSITGPSSVADGLWHHIVGTYDGITARLYVDGVQVNSLVYNGGALEYAVGAVRINDRVGDIARRVDGPIDEVAIYPTALSAARIAAHYAARVTRRVGFQNFERFRDHTSAALRVRVVGLNVEYTATDWEAWGKAQQRLTAEPNAPTPRLRQLPDVIDLGLTTVAECQQRAFIELRRVASRVSFSARVFEDGLQPGQRIDVISAAIGKGVGDKPSFRNTRRVGGGAPGIANGMGRYLIQRISPQTITNDRFAYEVQFGDYEPLLAGALAQS